MALFLESADVPTIEESKSAVQELTAAVSPSEASYPWNVAIVGFGTVGQSVARILSSRRWPTLRLTHICNRDIARKKVDWVPADVQWTDRIDDVLSANVQIVVELIGGLSPATEWIRRALASGRSVVTANKQVIAQCGPELIELAHHHGRRLGFEAAVAGGIPIVRGLQEGLAGDRLVRILGILNGTCNYILTRMESAHVPFADALKEAQELGFAEADPSADIDGLDAQAKLAILCAVGLQRYIAAAEIPLRSIAPIEPIDFVYARRLECTIRQVSRATLEEDGGRVLASVQPMLVRRSSALARTDGSQNVVVVEGEFGGETAFSGFGAGGNPTAVAVVSDLVSIARGGPAHLAHSSAPAAHPGEVDRDFVAPQYVRFIVDDRPGIIATLASVFSRHDINVDSVLQEPGWSKSALPFVMTLESCSASSVREALREVEACDFHVRRPLWLPVLTGGGSPA